MIPFDDETMMVMLELPDMPDMSKGHIEKGPMEGMESESDQLLKKIYCMLKKHFGDEYPKESEKKEVEDEFQGCTE